MNFLIKTCQKLCRVTEVDLLNIAVNTQKMKAMKTFQLILVGSCVRCVEIATCGYLLAGISFKQASVKQASFVLEKISKEVCYNVENSSMGFCYMSLPIAFGNERELSMQSFCCFVSPKLSRLNPCLNPLSGIKVLSEEYWYLVNACQCCC